MKISRGHGDVVLCGERRDIIVILTDGGLGFVSAGVRKTLNLDHPCKPWI